MPSKITRADVASPRNITAQARLARLLIKDRPHTPSALQTALSISPADLAKVIVILKRDGVVASGGMLHDGKPTPGRINEKWWGNEWMRYGLVSDTHLCCKEERLEELGAQYDLFKREGITTVLHAGNICEGFIAKINGTSVYETTVDGQAEYVIKNYPKRDGIVTKFITGDDHEGWWIQSSGISFGRHLEHLAREFGRTDLVYIGHVEGDIAVKCPDGESIIKVQHPGGGSSYARSYTAQKQIEAFEGGEKPAILIQGHYHVSNYMQDRNVHVVNLPGFQDQTIFARKKRLRMEVGGAIMEFKLAPDASVSRFRIEFNRFFNRGFYKNFLRHDRRA